MALGVPFFSSILILLVVSATMWRYCGSTPLLVSVHLKQTATGWCVIPVIAKVVQQVVPVQQCKVVLLFVLARLVFNKAAYGLWRIVLISVGFPFSHQLIR